MNADNANIKGLYVHIPFCDGKCDYCAFYSIPYAAPLADAYVNAVVQELDSWQPLAPETIYFGGGTPSRLSESQMARLCQGVLARISRALLREWSVEFNPGSASDDLIRLLLDQGVNRFSVGIQSLDDRVLKSLGRRHTAVEALTTVERLRRLGARNVGVDLIACVPGVDRVLWDSTLQRVLQLAPEHVSVYALTGEEGSRLQRAVDGGQCRLLSDDEQLDALDAAQTRLIQAGYRRYEISNYARPGYECQHHLSCWRGGEYIGLGPAASSHVGARRWTHPADVEAYVEALRKGEVLADDLDPLTPEIQQQERLIFGLRMAEGVSESVAVGYEPALEILRDQGLVTRQADRWMLTDRGRNLADYVAVELMSHQTDSAA